MNEDTNNILNEDLGGVDISFPVLPLDEYVCTIKEMVKTWPKRIPEGARLPGSEHMCNILLTTTTPAVSTSGDPVPAGFPIRDRLMLRPTEKMTVASIKRGLATFRAAVLGTQSGAFDPVSQYIGKNVRVKVKPVAAEGDYPARNEVKAYIVQ